jgi:flagellar export protein FliJ
MPFRFPLETVLHFRQSLERQQELRLRAANQQVIGARHLIDQLDRRAGEIRHSQSQQLQDGTTAAELRFVMLGRAALAQHRAELERELGHLQHLRNEQQKLFEEQRRQRETLEGLRDGQRRLYERAAARREQRNLDDLYRLQRSHDRLQQFRSRRG